jgi:hypothetical protein
MRLNISLKSIPEPLNNLYTRPFARNIVNFLLTNLHRASKKGGEREKPTPTLSALYPGFYLKVPCSLYIGVIYV